MKHKTFLFIFLFVLLLSLAACNPTGGSESDSVTLDHCAEVEPGTKQLIVADLGICFLYPDNYEVAQNESGSLTLYVDSLLNTEAPLASINVLPLDGRTIQEVVPDYPSDAELAATSFLTIDLDGEQATVIDTIPGQDINRRIFAQHEGQLVDIMIARFGPEYGEVGEQAEALYDVIIRTWRFIAIEPSS